MEPVQEPTIGRIVHWVTKSGTHRPAIITSVASWQEYGTINLVVFGGKYNSVEMKEVPFSGGEVEPAVAYTKDEQRTFPTGTWHWPERADA